MTLGGIRPLFANVLSSLNYKEWPQAFNVNNIPANILTDSFHVAVAQVNAQTPDQQSHAFKTQVTVRVFFKGYRDPNAVKDAALDKAGLILNAILRPSVRLGTEGLQDIRPVSVNPVGLAGSNDNSLILEMVFEVSLNYRFT